MSQYLLEFLKIAGIIATGLFSTTGIVAFFKWFTNRNMITAETDRVPSAGWRSYAEKLEKRLDEQDLRMEQMRIEFDRKFEDMQLDYERRLKVKDALLDSQEMKYKADMLARDNVITGLQRQIGDLRYQMNQKLAMAEVAAKVKVVELDAAKTDIHQAVDDNIDKLKPSL